MGNQCISEFLTISYTCISTIFLKVVWDVLWPTNEKKYLFLLNQGWGKRWFYLLKNFIPHFFIQLLLYTQINSPATLNSIFITLTVFNPLTQIHFRILFRPSIPTKTLPQNIKELITSMTFSIHLNLHLGCVFYSSSHPNIAVLHILSQLFSLA